MALTFPELLARAKRELNQKIDEYNDIIDDYNEAREASTPDTGKIEQLRTSKSRLKADVDQRKSKLIELEREAADDEELTRRAKESHPTAAADIGLDGAETIHAGGGSKRTSAGPVWVREDGRSAVLARGQRFSDHEVVKHASQQRASADAAVVGQHGGLGQLVRALSTTSGSAVVPQVWAGDVIDLARNNAAVLQAGAQIVPMDAKTVQVGRLTTDPTAAFRVENSAITASDPAFDNVTLTAKTMNALVVGSLEWFQDADNADQLVTQAIAQAIARKLDLVALYGGITTGSGAGINLPAPNPVGVLAGLVAQVPANVLGAATNGTTQTVGSFWGEVLDTVYTVKDANEDPNALIWSTKLERLYAKATDTTGQPLARPAILDDLQILSSNQIPSFTQGTMTNVATDLFVGDWTQLLVGQRLDLSIQVLTERYADNGQIGILATWRGDIGLARPRAFAAFRALKGA